MRRLISSVLLLGACGAPPPLPPVHAQHVIAAAHLPPASAPGSFWEEVVFEIPDADRILHQPKPTDLAPLVRAEMKERFAALSEGDRKKLLDLGTVTTPRDDHEASIARFYEALRSARIPFVLTLSSLFALTFGVIERALDEADRDVIAPTLQTMLAEMDTRLAAETRAANSDTLAAYALARAFVVVARLLLDPSVERPRTLALETSREVARIQEHAGPAKSPLLGVTIDYGAFDAQAGLLGTDPRIGSFRALSWLARAPLALLAHAGVGEQAARTQTRAALLLSRSLFAGDAAGRAFARIDDVERFITGPADDPGPVALLRVCAAGAIDIREERTIADVTRIDRVRRQLAHGAPALDPDAGPSFRFLGTSATPDAREVAASGSTASVAVVLGRDGPHPEMPTDTSARHVSLHLSALDALAAYVSPSRLEAPWENWRAHKLNTVLSAWSALRHADLPMSHASARALMDEAIPEEPEPVVAAIEPHPEAIARLLALVRQTARGLVAHHALREGGAALQLLVHLEALLADALRITVVQDRVLSAKDARTLDEMPAKIAAIERRLGRGAAHPIVTVVREAPTSLLEAATGFVDETWMILEMASGPVLMLGAHVPFYEMASTLRSTDESWTHRLREAPPTRFAE